MSTDPRTVTAADLANPALDALTLHGIAQERPDLWPLVVQHPNSYAALNEWIAQQQAARAAVAPEETVPVSEASTESDATAAEPQEQAQPAAEDAAATLVYPPLTPVAPAAYPATGAYPQPVYPQAAYPQPVPQGYPVAPGQPGAYPVMPGQYVPRKAKGSPLGPILMFVAALAFLVAGGLPAATSPRETVALVDLETPFTFSAFVWFALLISSIVVWIVRTRGALMTGAIFGFVCGAAWVLIGVGNALAASAAGWSLGPGFFALIVVGILAIVGGVLALLKRPTTTYV